MNIEAPDTATARLTKKIARLQSDLALREMDRAEATLAQLTNPNDPESRAQLDKAAKDIADMRATIEGAEGALALQQSRDLDAERDEAEAARQEAAREARTKLSDVIKLAQRVDKATDAFVAALAEMNDSYHQISRLTYDAGVRGDQRHNLTSNLLSIKHAGSVLAARLLTAGFHDRLDYLIVTRPGFPLDTTFADIARGNAERVDSQLDRALSA